MVGKRIRLLRQEKDLTQEAFGSLFGVRNNTVSQWETGINEPDSAMLTRIAERFGVTLDWLLGRAQERAPVTRNDDERLAARWPNLSPDRRRRAAQMERDGKESGIDDMHLGRGLTNQQFDDLIRGMTAFAALMAKQKATE